MERGVESKGISYQEICVWAYLSLKEQTQNHVILLGLRVGRQSDSERNICVKV